MSAVEQAILGAALATPELATEVAAKLTPNDFYEPRHQLIHQALTSLVEGGKPTDAVSVISQLGDDVNRVGGHAYMFDLMQSACVTAALPHHINTLRGQATTRRLHTAGQQITQLADTLPAHDAVPQAQALLDALIQADSGEVTRVGDTLEGTLDRILSVQEGTAPQGLMTGLNDLDRLTNGFQGGQMVIVAARPGVGKSTLAVDFMRHASIRNNIPTLMFSLEMGTDEINQRIISAETSIPLAKMKKPGGLDQQAWAKIGEAKQNIEQAPLMIDDSAENTIMDIVAKTKLLVKREGVQMVVVDYLQLLKSGVREESRQQEVSSFSRQLKLLAKACDIPVIAVAQLNRESEKRGEDAKPKPSDLRESGALEQDADIILLIHRPETGNPDHQRAGEADIIVGKNRAGQSGVVSVSAQMHYARFGNLAKGF